MSHQYQNRRTFLKSSVRAATAAGLTPYFFSRQRTLADEIVSKNDRIPIGLIGAGGMGIGNMRSAARYLDVVAIADVDVHHRDQANAELSQGKADVYEDYRKILDRDDIDVVHIATPDHWHTKPLVEAMLAGKDVYCEKPLTLTIDEGKLIRKVQKETGRIVQVGTQQRSTYPLFVKAIAMVQAGRLGKLKRVQAAVGGAPSSPLLPVAPVPAELNWDQWLGPVPVVDYRYLAAEPRALSNCHFEFRWWYEFSGGKLTDWGAHHVDICTWALAVNGQTDGPLSIGGQSKHPVDFKDGMPLQNDRYNTATEFLFEAEFPGGTQMVIRHDTDNGALLEGDQGRIFVNRGKLVGAPVEALKDDPLPEDAIRKAYKGLPIQENERRAHWANFLHCVRARKEPISDVHSHMKTLNICHLAGITARLGRTIKWNDQTEQIEGDAEANTMLTRPYRQGFAIEM